MQAQVPSLTWRKASVHGLFIELKVILRRKKAFIGLAKWTCELCSRTEPGAQKALHVGVNALQPPSCNS